MSKVVSGSVAALKKQARKHLNAASKAARIWWFYDFGLGLLDDAVVRAPIRYGKLRLSAWAAINSGVVVATGTAEGGAKQTGRALGKSNREAVLTIGFGGTNGGNLPYAKWVHEITWRKHKVGEAKFLHNAVMAAMNQALPGLGAVVQAALKRGTD